jgi:hypothetical protein
MTHSAVLRTPESLTVSDDLGDKREPLIVPVLSLGAALGAALGLEPCLKDWLGRQGATCLPRLGCQRKPGRASVATR